MFEVSVQGFKKGPIYPEWCASPPGSWEGLIQAKVRHIAPVDVTVAWTGPAPGSMPMVNASANSVKVDPTVDRYYANIRRFRFEGDYPFVITVTDGSGRQATATGTFVIAHCENYQQVSDDQLPLPPTPTSTP